MEPAKPGIDPALLAAMLETTQGVRLDGPDAERAARSLTRIAATLDGLPATGLFDTEPARFYGFIESEGMTERRS